MAASVSSQLNPYVDKLIVDTDCNTTVTIDVLSGGATSYIFDVDNSNNATQLVVLKAWNHASPTLDGSGSSTEPDLIFTIPAGKRQTITISSGIYFGNALSFACTTGSATTSNTSPTNPVTVRIMAE
jgi:hypothetical protein